jgi:hypothetical protein
VSIRLHASLLGIGPDLLDAGAKHIYLILQAIQPLEDIAAVGFFGDHQVELIGSDHEGAGMQDSTTQQSNVSGDSHLAARAAGTGRKRRKIRR